MEPPTIMPPIPDFNSYDGCGVTKVCFGGPLIGCVERQDCDLFGAVIFENDKFTFELLSKRKFLLSRLISGILIFRLKPASLTSLWRYLITMTWLGLQPSNASSQVKTKLLHRSLLLQHLHELL